MSMVNTLIRHKHVVVVASAVSAFVGAAITLALPDTYIATARLLPPQQQQSMVAAALLGNLGGLLGMSGNPFGIKNPADLYIGMMQSRTVADALIERFELKKLYDQETMSDTRKQLRLRTSLRVGKDGLIVIDVEDENPSRAAALANAYATELDILTQRIAVTDAGQRRLFLERQLKQTRDALASAEVAMRKTQEVTGLIQLQDQGRAIIEAIASLRARITSKEVQLAALRTFATENNADYVVIQRELSALRSELVKLERDNPGQRGNPIVPTGKVPELGLEYLRSLRDVKYHETLFELLAKQYELARLEEANNNGIVQVVDVAVAPDRKSGPKRLLITLFAAALGLVLAVLAVLTRERLRNS